MQLQCVSLLAYREASFLKKNSDMFVIEKLAYIMRKSKGLYRIEIDINKDYIFTLYTYAQTLEEYEKEKEEEEEG